MNGHEKSHAFNFRSGREKVGKCRLEITQKRSREVQGATSVGGPGLRKVQGEMGGRALSREVCFFRFRQFTDICVLLSQKVETKTLITLPLDQGNSPQVFMGPEQ